MKRFLRCLLCVVPVLVIALAGCGGSVAPSGKPSTGPAPLNTGAVGVGVDPAAITPDNPKGEAVPPGGAAPGGATPGVTPPATK